MNLQEIRQQYPQYNDLDDQQLTEGLHGKFYSDMPFNEFAAAIGYAPTPEATAGRIVGRFFQTVKSTPARAGAAYRNRIEAMDSPDMARRIRNASAGQTFLTGNDFLDEVGLVNVQARKTELIDDGYHPDAAEQHALIEHVERRKKAIADEVRKTEQRFAMPDRYQKSSGILEDIAGGLGTSMVSIPAYAMHPLIGALQTYGQIAGAKVQELEGAGLTDPVEIMKAARVSAAIQTPLEALSDIFIISRILKPTGRWTSALVSIGQSMAGEGATEFVQQYPDEFATMMALNPDLSDRELWRAFYDRLPEITGNAAYAGLVGSLAGGITTGTGIGTMAVLDKMITPQQRIENDAKRERLERFVDSARAGTITEEEFAGIKDMLGIDENADLSVDDVVSDVERRIRLSGPIESENRASIQQAMSTALGEEKARPIIDLMDSVARAWARRNDTDPALFYQDVIGGFRQDEAERFLAAQQQGAAYQTDVYHGSPYSFGRFSTDRIGTGEGTGTFGWGLYFTDNEDVARYYADKNVGRGATEADVAARLLQATGGDRQRALEEIGRRRKIANMPGAKERFDRVAEMIRSDQVLGRNLYESTINPDRADVWLDWYNKVDAQTVEKIADYLESRGHQEIAGRFKGAAPEISGQELYSNLSELYGSDKEASLFLKRAGVDGIRYPVGTIHETEHQGLNYVVFDENAVRLNERIQFQRENKKPWPAGFPNAVVHTTVSKMRAHKDYQSAKSGDIEAAYNVVNDLVKPEKIKTLLREYPDAIVVAPHAQESAGKNAIPRAIAEAFGDAGFEVNTDIVQANRAERTEKSGSLRLAIRPEFDGEVKKGRKYIIVDDAIGQGGTLSELRHYIENSGGVVVHISALTAGRFGTKVAITKETIQKIEQKFGRKETEDFLYEHNTAGSIEALTEKEGRKLLGSPSLDALRNRILERAREAGISPTAWQIQAPVRGQGLKPLFQGPKTLRARIDQAGGINFLHFRGELKELPEPVKRLSRKSGMQIDLLEEMLKSEGWLSADEDLLDLLRDPESLKRDNPAADLNAGLHDLDGPPEGDYKTDTAENLPENQPIVILSDSSAYGWGIYTITEKDPFEITLTSEDGETLVLGPLDRIDYMVLDRRDRPIDRNAPRGAVTNLFTDLPKIIHAFESADPSTPIHELGHILTGMLADERTDDYFALAEFAGVEPDRASAGLQGWTDDELEAVARAFEVYVMEGRAPSLRLRDVFRMMRDWLLDVYKSIRALEVDLTDNVRSVFDRLLAADFERQDDLVSEVDEWLASGDIEAQSNFSYFAATPKDIEREAIHRVATAGARERKARDREMRSKFQKRARKRVEGYPYFKMIADMRAGGLSIDALKTAFDDRTVKAMLSKLPGIIKAGGQDPYRFAIDHGYHGLEAMVDDIIGAPTKADAIREYFDSLWGEYRKSQAIENADFYIRVLNEQEKILSEITGQSARDASANMARETGRPMDEEAFKKAVKDFKRDREIARRAYAAGQESRQEKLKKLQKTITKQADRMQRIRDTQKARADREKINRRMQRIIRAKSLPPEYQAQINHFLAEYYNLPATFTIIPDEPLEAFLDRKYDSNSWAVDSIRAELTRKPVQDRNQRTGYRIPLTDAQLEVVANIADMLAHMGSTEGKLIKEQEKADLLETVVSMAEPMIKTHGHPGEDFGRPTPPSARRLNWWQRMSDTAKRYIAELRKAEFIFQAADGWETFGPNWKNLFLPIKAAEDAELVMGKQLHSKIDAAFEKIGSPRDRRKWAMKKYRVDGFADRLTKEEMVMIALNSGNVGNLTALREGFGWDDDMIKAVWHALTAEEVTLVNEIWDAVDDLYPHLDRVHMQLTGVHLPKVEGRYFPLVFDKDLAWQAGAFAEQARQRDMFATAYTRPSVQAGHRKTRTGGKMPPHLSFSVISRHVVSAVHDATHQLAVRNAQQIIAHPVYRGAMTASMGDATYRQLMPWLQDVANPRREPATQVDRWIGRLRRNSTIVALGYKVTVATKQFLSFTQTIAELGLKNALRGLAVFYADPWRMSAFIRESSVMIRQRKTQWDRELNQFARDFDPSASPGMDRVKDAFFAMIGMMDVAATYPTWLAGYQVGMDKFNGDHKQAVENADLVVRRTQPVASPKDMSTMQRGGETRSELRKLFTMFYTFFSVFQNRLQETRQRHKLGNINTTQALLSYWWIMVLPAMLSEMISKRKWPWEIGPVQYAKGIAGYWAAAFPYLRDIATPWLTGFGYTMTPVESAMESFAELPKVVFTDKPSPRRIARQAIKATGYAVGLPSSQMVITMDGVIDLMQDKTDNPWRLIFSEQREEEKRDLY